MNSNLKKKIKYFSVLVVVFALLLSLTGCGGKANYSNTYNAINIQSTSNPSVNISGTLVLKKNKAGSWIVDSSKTNLQLCEPTYTNGKFVKVGTANSSVTGIPSSGLSQGTKFSISNISTLGAFGETKWSVDCKVTTVASQNAMGSLNVTVK